MDPVVTPLRIVRSAPADATPAAAASPDAAGDREPSGPSHGARREAPRGGRLAILTLAALGVVYGDIGTSPLYTVREAFAGAHRLEASVGNVYGILSLIFWTILLVVVLKYLVFILRADNRGEGGVLAMLALLLPAQESGRPSKRLAVYVLLGVFGTALLYGDGIITPAISVLGAIEGLSVMAPPLAPFIVGISMAILLALFLVQRFGTARVGRTFGPITLLWFVTIAILGLREILRSPHVLLAANPWHAIQFFRSHGTAGFIVLGAVFLAVTGSEALYADIGHFGKRPIRLAFFALVLPALLLNYFGQGALLLRDPSAIANPFYLLAPHWFLYPLLLIATLAAIVASQALISGAFSLAQQSVQLGYAPRLTIIHTSREEYGQIYVPEVNVALMVGTLLIVASFESSGALSAAYGIAVTGTMSITTILFAAVARTRWGWPASRVAALTALFLTIDLAFLGANSLKIDDGGYVPLLLALAILIVMTTWKKGRETLTAIVRRTSLPLELLLEEIGRHPPFRVSGTAVFLTSDPDGAPMVLLHHLKHNKALHRQVVLLSITSELVPEVDPTRRVRVTPLGHGFYRVIASYGFRESPNVPMVLAECAPHGLHVSPMDTSYFLNRERLLPTGTTAMATWRKLLFVIMSRNARSAAQFFSLPPNRVVELGAQIEF